MKVQYSIFNFFNAHTLSTDTWDSQGIPPPLPKSLSIKLNYMYLKIRGELTFSACSFIYFFYTCI